MQTRPYDEKNGQRVWLSRTEQQELLDTVSDQPRRKIALQLGMHGLRTDEVLKVAPEHVRELANGADGHVLVIPDGKTGKRETPVSDDLAQSITYLKSAAQLRESEPILDVTTRTIRNWMTEAAETFDDAGDDLGMHDLRRTWATDSYYSLALAGVPIAEQLVMSWGGWKQTTTGRETFRENYLGPVPDHVTASALESLPLQ